MVQKNAKATEDTAGYMKAQRELHDALERGEDAEKWFKRNAHVKHGKWTYKDIERLYIYYYGVECVMMSEKDYKCYTLR